MKPNIISNCAAVLFCARCGSNCVDQNALDAAADAIEVRCYSCGHAANLQGFRVGRAYRGEALREAAQDIA